MRPPHRRLSDAHGELSGGIEPSFQRAPGWLPALEAGVPTAPRGTWALGGVPAPPAKPPMPATPTKPAVCLEA